MVRGLPGMEGTGDRDEGWRWVIGADDEEGRKKDRERQSMVRETWA